MTSIQTVRSLRLRDKQVAAVLGIGRSTVWVWAKNKPGFPQPRRDGGACTYWLADEVEAYARQGATTPIEAE